MARGPGGPETLSLRANGSNRNVQNRVSNTNSNDSPERKLLLKIISLLIMMPTDAIVLTACERNADWYRELMND